MEEVSSSAYVWKVVLLVIFVFLDIIFGSLADHFWADDTAMVFVCIGGQLAMQAFLLITFFTLLWQSFLLRFGLLGEFRFVLIFAVIRTGLLCASRIPRLLAAADDSTFSEYWNGTTYALYIAQTVVGAAYHVALLRATFSLGQAKYYKADIWKRRTGT